MMIFRGLEFSLYFFRELELPLRFFRELELSLYVFRELELFSYFLSLYVFRGGVLIVLIKLMSTKNTNEDPNLLTA
jgi:hypothetical protein